MSGKILIVSESDDAHVKIISKSLEKRKIPWSWLKTDCLMEENISWAINESGKAECGLCDSEVTTIWYRRRHAPFGIPKSPVEIFTQQENEGFLDSLLLQYVDKRWVNSLQSLLVSRPKINQLKLARKWGLAIPDSLITNSAKELSSFYEKHNGKVIVKPIQTQVVECLGGGLVVGTRSLPFGVIKNAVSITPCYAQKKLEIETEVRVVVFGEKHFAFSQKPKVAADDIKQLAIEQIDYTPFTLKEEDVTNILSLVRNLGLEFAACDFVVTKDGKLVFLEVNPNGQWLWLQYVADINMEDTFVDFLCK